MTAAFFGHGSPMNALGGNRYAAAWRAFGERVRPRAILMISAHWYAAGLRITAGERPRTNHDFVSFRGPLGELVYPARGDRALAARVCDLLAPEPVARDERWGYDHGAWSVLMNAYPQADVPVVELCLDRTRPPSEHYALARRLAPLRDEGVLIAGSGNAIHNIELLRGGWADAPPGWQRRFNDDLLRRLDRGDMRPSWPTSGSVRTRSSRSRRPTTTCRCSTCWACNAPGNARRSSSTATRWVGSACSRSRSDDPGGPRTAFR
jgi:4,5-DOPA dioxygenase extradiol